MTEKMIPAIIITPGEVLKEELDARGLTQSDLALIINRPEQTISEIINAKKQITAETANDLEQALNIPATFWLNLETNYQLHLVQHQERDQAKARRAQLMLLAPLRQMFRRKWVEMPADPTKVESVVEKYLGINPLDAQPALTASFRYTTMKEPDTLALIVWLKRIEYLTEQADIAPFNKDALKNRIPDILQCAVEAEDVVKIKPILAECGVYLTIVPHLEKTFLDGAACFYHDRGAIGLTLRYDRIDSFWFTLLHEVAHLLEDNNHCYIDTIPSVGKSDGDDEKKTMSNEEMQANLWARNRLIPPDKFADFIEEASPYFTQDRIEGFAKAIERHPGIVLGRLMRDRNVKYSYLRGLLVKVGTYLEVND